MTKRIFHRCLIATCVFGEVNQPPMKLNKLTPNLYEIDGKGGNVVVYVTGEGVILVDDKNPGEAITNELLSLIKSVTSEPIKYVFITHYHQDHMGGNGEMLSLGAQIISTVTTRDNIVGPVWKSVQVFDMNGKFLREQPYSPASAKGEWTPVGPPIVFNDEADVFLGGKEVKARFFRAR